ncbi:Cysteine-rich with EGF-like domain protein 2 [Sarcoptes scabiei]|uniref:Polynucleotide 5'-hydroxyl-kinase NOL9 n=1 Tax=Sarcoptes scabiei TaxID=52283 RepID=A0A834R558_SARSC|nr:Cysteine-rich with EGF-like domain protein 2 [Sarcoptes scabiei]
MLQQSESFPVVTKELSQHDSGLKFFRINDDTICVIVSNRIDSLWISEDFCGRITLIPFTSEYFLCSNGYVADLNESIEISTCFMSQSCIYFLHQLKIKKNSRFSPDVKAFSIEKYDFARPYSDQLMNGSSLLLEFQYDREAFKRYKLAIQYLNLSSQNDLKLWCQRKSLLSLGNRSEKICSETSRIDWVRFFQHRQEFYRELAIKPDDIILVFGPCNSGKTSLIHDLINRYISENGNSVSYLECDPGQSEFTPCGILGLNQINCYISNALGHKYLFGKSQLLTVPEKMVSKMLGTIALTEDHVNYISLIEELRKFLKHFKGPLFINTMGWIETIGLELLKKIISIFNPNHLIRIDSDLMKPHSHVLIDKSLNRFSKLDDLREIFNAIQSKKESKKLWITSFEAVKLYRTNLFFKSRIRREINQLLYIISSLWPSIIILPFYTIEPIKLSLHNLFIYCSDDRLTDADSIYDLLNISWVLFGTIDEKEMNELEFTTLNRKRYFNEDLRKEAIEASNGKEAINLKEKINKRSIQIMENGENAPSDNRLRETLHQNDNYLNNNPDHQSDHIEFDDVHRPPDSIDVDTRIGANDLHLNHLDCESQNEDGLKLLKQMPKIGNCLGCGIVRSVDHINSNLMLITTSVINQSETNRINYLMIPKSIHPPPSFMIEQFSYLGNRSSPFIHLEIDVEASNRTKRKRVNKRRISSTTRHKKSQRTMW